MNNIAAIVVTFNPDPPVLKNQLSELKAQDVRVVLVDNGSALDVAEWNRSQARPADDVVSLKQNLGIAAAHNVGIKWAKSVGATHVLLMDQDSVPDPGMVKALWHHAKTIQNLAAIGPRYIDERQNNPPPFIQIRGLEHFRYTTAPEGGIVPVDYLISSGSLIPLSTLDLVGGMREDLFIDYVDIEWGLRAKQKGFQSFGAFDATMRHSLGENPVKFFNRLIPIHSPLRHYYHFRNAVLLYKSPWLPLNWKVVDGTRLILRYGFYTLFAKPRIQHWWMMTLGLFHGLINRGGKY